MSQKGGNTAQPETTSGNLAATSLGKLGDSFTTASNYGADLYCPMPIIFSPGSLSRTFTSNVADIKASYLKSGELSHAFTTSGNNAPYRFSIVMAPKNQPDLADIKKQLSGIEDYISLLNGLEGPAKAVLELDDEQKRSSAYKKIIAARPELKNVKFDQDGDGIITTEEFNSVRNFQKASAVVEWHVLNEEKDILNQENTPDGKILKLARDGLTAQGLMNNDPDVLTTAGLISTAAITTLRNGIFGASGGKGKEKKNDFWHHMLILQQLQDRSAQLGEQIAEGWKRIKALDLEIKELRERIETLELALEDRYGKDWRVMGKDGELNGAPLYIQYREENEVLSQKLTTRATEHEQVNDLIQKKATTDLSIYLKTEQSKQAVEQNKQAVEQNKQDYDFDKMMATLEEATMNAQSMEEYKTLKQKLFTLQNIAPKQGKNKATEETNLSKAFNPATKETPVTDTAASEKTSSGADTATHYTHTTHQPPFPGTGQG